MKRHTRVLNVKYIRPNEVIWGRHKIILAENPSGPGVRFYMEGRGPTVVLMAIRGNRKVLTSLSPPPPPYRSTALTPIQQRFSDKFLVITKCVCNSAPT